MRTNHKCSTSVGTIVSSAVVLLQLCAATCGLNVRVLTTADVTSLARPIRDCRVLTLLPYPVGWLCLMASVTILLTHRLCSTKRRKAHSADGIHLAPKVPGSPPKRRGSEPQNSRRIPSPRGILGDAISYIKIQVLSDVHRVEAGSLGGRKSSPPSADARN